MKCESQEQKSSIRHMLLAMVVFFVGFNTHSAMSDDDIVLQRVTKSISEVYVVASECVDTLSPGPDQYVVQIDEYFKKLYTNGVSYWVLPPIKEKQTNREMCIINLESRLLNYQRSLYDFRINYPRRIQPPMLLAYRWRDKNIQEEQSTPSALPIIAPSKFVRPDSRF